MINKYYLDYSYNLLKSYLNLNVFDNENCLFVLAKIAYSAPKSTVSLAEGMPNEETFPFTEISVKLYDGSSFILDESELGAALQYIPTQGYPPLVQVENNFHII